MKGKTVVDSSAPAIFPQVVMTPPGRVALSAVAKGSPPTLSITPFHFDFNKGRVPVSMASSRPNIC